MVKAHFVPGELYPEQDCWLYLLELASDANSVRGLPAPPVGIDNDGGYYHIVPYPRSDGTVTRRLWYKYQDGGGIVRHKIGTWVTDRMKSPPMHQSSITTEGNEVVVNAGQWNEWVGIVRLDKEGRCKGMPYLEPKGERR